MVTALLLGPVLHTFVNTTHRNRYLRTLSPFGQA